MTVAPAATRGPRPIRRSRAWSAAASKTTCIPEIARTWRVPVRSNRRCHAGDTSERMPRRSAPAKAACPSRRKRRRRSAIVRRHSRSVRDTPEVADSTTTLLGSRASTTKLIPRLASDTRQSRSPGLPARRGWRARPQTDTTAPGPKPRGRAPFQEHNAPMPRSSRPKNQARPENGSSRASSTRRRHRTKEGGTCCAPARSAAAVVRSTCAPPATPIQRPAAASQPVAGRRCATHATRAAATPKIAIDTATAPPESPAAAAILRARKPATARAPARTSGR